MEWSIKYGDTYDFYKKLQDDGRESPLDDLPKLDIVEYIYYEDFNYLSSERNSGMGISAIPVTKVLQYAILEGVHNVQLFKRIICAIDNAYLRMHNDKQKAESKKSTKGKK